ncbi:MAG: hypothetical protein IJU81_05370 [Bacteroidales bacterium]|nr:hypothetical protein [Bacteroidales bacterium]
MKKFYIYILMLALAVSATAQNTYFAPSLSTGIGGLRVNRDCPYNYNKGIGSFLGFDIINYFYEGHGLQFGVNVGHSGGIIHEWTRSFPGVGTQSFVAADGTVSQQDVHYTLKPSKFSEQYDFWNVGIPISYTYKYKEFFMSAGVEFIIPLSLKATNSVKGIDMYLGPEIPDMGIVLDDPISIGDIDDYFAVTELYSRNGTNNYAEPSFVDFIMEAGVWMPLSEKADLLLSVFLDYAPKKVKLEGGSSFVEMTPSSIEYNTLMHSDAITSLRFFNIGIRLKLAFGAKWNDPCIK